MMDEVFRALSNPSRRRLLDRLNDQSGQTLHELCAGPDMARQSVSKHLAVLEAANLITTVRRGRQKLHYLNAAPISEIADRWIGHYDRRRVHALADLKRALEESPVSKPEFVYTTYIRATPDQLWRALTEPAFTEQYWGLGLESAWTPGSPMKVVLRDGVVVDDSAQVVLEAEPGRRLAYTWHTFSPEWATVYGVSEADRATFAAERRSKVTFTIDEVGDLCRLTVVHDDFDPGSAVLAGVSQGWPMILSALKTLLETGAALPQPSA